MCSVFGCKERLTISEGKNRYPCASSFTTFYMWIYMWILTEVESIDEAKILINEKQKLTELLKLDQFELHKWRSNYAGMLCGTNNVTEFQTTSDDHKVVTLGLQWVSESDMLQFES